MPPFQYQPFQNPYVQSISALMEAPGQIEAQRATAVAQAQAEAARASGQAWAGAAQNIGQSVSGTIQQATDPRRKMEQTQVSDLAALDKAFTQPGGRDAILAALPGHLRPQVSAQFAAADEAGAKVNEANLNAEKATTDYVTGLAENIKAHNYDPSAAQLALSHAKLTFKNNPSLLNQVTQIESAIQQNGTPQAVQAIVDPILKAHEAQEKPVILPATPRGGAPAQLVNPGTGVAVATGPPAPVQPPTEPELALRAGAGDTAAAAAMGILKPTPKGPNSEKATFSLDGKTNVEGSYVPGVNGAPGKYIYNGDDVTAKVKGAAPASMTVNPALLPSGDALTMAAQRYLATGELPSMGMGQAGAAARVAVMNAAAKIDPQASLALNKATYKADSTNLTNLQKTEGTLSAFENTAGKNLDQFLTLANKIPDTGVPWLNTPVRLLNQQMVGSENMAAINAARDVALREIARVTNDPKLSGALTDSARKEVSSLSPTNATLPQIKAVVNVLKQDMANVHAGLTQQISSVKDTMSAHPGAPPSASTQMPDLTGLTAGHGRTFNSGPFAGQTWTVGPNGQPQQVTK